LGIHADFRINNKLHLRRRMNVIIYLNQDWQQEYNGSLELWSRDMKHAVQRIAPLWNRCVVFNTDADSWHGHPDPLHDAEGSSAFAGALLLHGVEGHLRRSAQSLDHVRGAAGDDVAVRREAQGLRMEQHLASWVPPELLRYSRGVMRRVRKLVRRQS
jgi:hypothetical protein